jgi:hypothetical protein
MTKTDQNSAEKAKAARLAAALRANLARRKARDRGSVEPPEAAEG